MVIYFSGTGNSRYVAEAIADRLEDQVVCANQYIKEEKGGEFESRNPWVFVFPVYVSAMAEVFQKFIEKSTFSGCRKAYFVATCAAAMGISPNIAAGLCRDKHLKYMGAEKVVMPQDYIALFHMTKPDEITARQKNALESTDRISQVIREGKSLDLWGKSKAEVAVTAGTVKLYNRFFTRADSFFTTDKCVGCGLCEKVCPLNNIHLEGGKPEWSKTCIHCMGCINRCPKGAIEYGRGTADKARYVCVKYKSLKN